MSVYDVTIVFRVTASSEEEAISIAEGLVADEADTVTDGADLAVL